MCAVDKVWKGGAGGMEINVKIALDTIAIFYSLSLPLSLSLSPSHWPLMDNGLKCVCIAKCSVLTHIHSRTHAGKCQILQPNCWRGGEGDCSSKCISMRFACLLCPICGAAHTHTHTHRQTNCQLSQSLSSPALSHTHTHSAARREL